MIRIILRAAALLAALSSAAPAQEVRFPDVEFGRYHALVIGNNAYRQLTPLNSAQGDAEAVGRLLRERYGFQVRTLLNATRHDITSAFNELRAELTEDDNLLVY